MGASFLSSHLEIQTGITPNWDAARNYINRLSDRKLGKIFIRHYDDPSVSEEGDILDNLGMSGTQARKNLLDAVKFLSEAWEEHTIYLNNSVLFIFAGESWGDPIEGSNEMELFYLSGAANVAGFMHTYDGPEEDD